MPFVVQGVTLAGHCLASARMFNGWRSPLKFISLSDRILEGYLMKVSKIGVQHPLQNLSAAEVQRPRKTGRGNRRFHLALATLGLGVPVVAQAANIGPVINFFDAHQGYAFYGGYQVLYYGQGAAPDTGNNVWNGFGQYGGPDTNGVFYGGGNPNSGLGGSSAPAGPHLPSGYPGNPYAWYSGNTTSGSNLFVPNANPATSGFGNAYSNGTISPITLSLSYDNDNGANGGIVQGSPSFLLSHAALASNGDTGTITLGGVPAVTGGATYDLYLYGANYDGTRGAQFNVTSGSYTAVGGITSTTNPNANGGSGPLNSFVLGQDYVEFVGITPNSAGQIIATWTGANNSISDLSGEGDFNGLQLVEVPAVPTYFYYGFDTLSPSGTANSTFGGTATNFNNSGSSAAFSNASTGSTAVFDDSAPGSHTITIVSGGVSPNVTLFNNSTSTYTINGGPITGPGSLQVNGGGTVTLNQSNSYTGGTTVGPAGGSGTLILGPSASIAASSLTIGGTSAVQLQGTNYSFAGLSGAGTVSTTGAGSSITLTGAGIYTGSLSLGTGSVTINATGSSQTLSGSNSYSGGTFLQAGTLLVGNGSLGSGTVSLQNGSIGAVTSSVAVPNLITGTALIVANSGTNLLELSGTANTFSGPVIIQSGLLQIDAAGSIGSATQLIVASGASFVVNDNTGNAGAGTTLQITGAGVSSAGALQSGANTSGGTFAGNVSVVGPSTIAAGANGILTLTGSITGNSASTVTFASNPGSTADGSLIILAPAAGKSSTYSGETQILPGASGSGSGQGVELGANNGISPNSGLNFISGTPQSVFLELNGFNQTVTYLQGGAVAGYQIQNSGSTTSTLTITSGTRAGVAANFGGAITGPINVVMNDPTGTGYQLLSGTNSYSGTTTITKGTLAAASSTAFGSGSVILKGGTAALSAVFTGATSILTPNSLSSFQLNNGQGDPASINGTTLNITDGSSSVSNSAFYPTPVTVSDKVGFTAHFTYDIVSGNSDGITFVLQNDPLGDKAYSAATSYEDGYGGIPLNQRAITNSAAVAFEIYPGNSHNNAGDGTAFTSGGYTPGETGSPAAAYTPTTVNLYGQPIDVNLVYNGPAQTLTETLTGDSDGTSETLVYTGIDYSALVGGPAGGMTTAYVGFTGGSGGAAAAQTISNISYGLNLTSPQSISNAVIASTAGTTSGIQLGLYPAGSNLTTGASVGPISISNGAIVKVSVSPSTSTNRGVLFTPSVSIASSGSSYSGQLDLGSNDLVVTNSNIATVTALVRSGYSNGTWGGQGIASSAANSNTSHLTALGTIINDTGANNGSSTGTPLYTTLDGADLTNGGTLTADGEILVKYTYYGDANLDGAVDGSDYSLVDSAYTYNKTHPTSLLTGWYNGDFNYDGVIDGSDYTLMDNAFNQQGSSLGSNPAALLATATAQVGGPAVPEPTSVALLGMSAVGLLGRRARRSVKRFA
jgi:fibronectin-binding autotransporter adhesin